MRPENEKERVADLKKRFERLKEERDKRLPDWKDVQQYIAPSVLNWDNPQDKIPKRPKGRFTTRPTQYARTLRTGLVGYSISPNIVWQKLTFEDQQHLDRIYGAKDWLEEVERILYAEFSSSNLYKASSQMIGDAVLYGHGLMLIDEVPEENKLRFTAIKIQEAFLDNDAYERTDTVFRRYSMSLRNAAEFFGKENLSETQKADLERNDNFNKEITIIHAVYKRDEFDDNSDDAKNMPYASVYLDESEDRILLESGYREFPYAVFIWEPVTGTPYGESPSIQAMVDIQLLNKHERSLLKMSQLAVEPPYNVPETMRGQENVVPNGFNYYSKPNEILQPINTAVNFPLSYDMYRHIEDRVKDWFIVDLFLALQQKQGKMTATEVVEMQGEKASMLSDLVINLNSALTKTIQRSFNLKCRQGMIPSPPRELVGIGAKMKIDFMGPLAQAQKKYHESGGIQHSLNIIAAVANIAGPTALDVVDFDATLKRGLEGAGFPQEAIREDKDIEELRRQRAEMQQEQQQQAMAMETQKQLMGNANKLNEPVHPGSTLAELNNQMAGGLS